MNYGVGTETNSKDPALLWSRVFVGNINTKHLGKEDVEHIFGRYGPIRGISMHQGYAFIQYVNEVYARLAVVEEDGNQYAGMTIDVNMAAEPKKKNQATGGGARTTATAHPLMRPPMAGGPRARTPNQVGPTPAKKFRAETPLQQQANKRNLVSLTGAGGAAKKPVISAPKQPARNVPRVTSKEISVVDILICGSCKQVFMTLEALTEHKDTPCGLKMSYKGDLPTSEDEQPESLQCASCDCKYANAWDLCVHAKEVHDMAIYSNEKQAEDINGEEMMKTECD